MSNSIDFDCVDSHFHIWDLRNFQYPWPTAAEAAIFKNFSPKDLQMNLTKTPVRHAVFVQCLNGSPEEAKWVIQQAKDCPFIKGVVAGIDLTSPQLQDVLDEMQKFPLFKGVRHILDMEEADWITREDVHAGLKMLEGRGISYDLLLRLKFVVDHIAKPYVKDKKIDGWREEITEIAKYPNVYCKLIALYSGYSSGHGPFKLVFLAFYEFRDHNEWSGLVTEADWQSWKKEDFQPYIDHVLQCFGVDRCMFGSDWPVCTLANTDYKGTFDLVQDLLSSLSTDDKKKIFRQNAADFYRLDLTLN